MATTPVTPKTDDKAPAKDTTKDAAAEKPKVAEAKAAKAAPKSPSIAPEAVWSVFYNGHRIAKQGDPPEKWISMGRGSDGMPVITSPLTPEMEKAVKEGEWYLVEDQGSYIHASPPGTAPTAPPTNVDIPYVSAMGQLASCTMGNWTGEPTSYAYAWQRNGSPIPGVVGATYSMTTTDSGKSIGCIVTATNAAGSTAAPVSNTIEAP